MILFHKNDHILDCEERDAAEIIQNRFIREGVRLMLNSDLKEIKTLNGEKIIHYEAFGTRDSVGVDEVLVGAGREPNVEDLGLLFNNLFMFANAPLGRFLAWLKQSGNLDSYMKRLIKSFNPCTVAGLMCRTLVSVNWDGYLYDCDFNLAIEAYLAGRKRHVSEMDNLPEPGTRIPTGNHCYACTAGPGFS